MGCQKKIAQKVLDKEADYLLAVKGNQGMLEQAFDDYFRMVMLQDFDGSSYSTQEKSHGRIETRVALVNRDLSVLGDIEHEWSELKSMGIVASIRQESAVATEQDVSIHYYNALKNWKLKRYLKRLVLTGV